MCLRYKHILLFLQVVLVPIGFIYNYLLVNGLTRYSQQAFALTESSTKFLYSMHFHWFSGSCSITLLNNSTELNFCLCEIESEQLFVVVRANVELDLCIYSWRFDRWFASSTIAISWHCKLFNFEFQSWRWIFSIVSSEVHSSSKQGHDVKKKL